MLHLPASLATMSSSSSSRSSSSMTCTNTDTAPLEETAPQRPSSLTRPISSHSVIAGERHTKQRLGILRYEHNNDDD